MFDTATGDEADHRADADADATRRRLGDRRTFVKGVTKTLYAGPVLLSLVANESAFASPGCYPIGSPCGDNEDCCADLVCDSDECCVDTGDSCSGNSDCCNNMCMGGMCM